MNEYYVFDEVPDHEAKGHRMETARWTEDFKPTADDPENVSRIITRTSFETHAHRGTQPLWALWDAEVAFLRSPLPDDERIYAVKAGYFVVQASILFGRLLKELFERAGFLSFVLIPNLFRYDPRELTVAIESEGEVTSLTIHKASCTLPSSSNESEESELAWDMKGQQRVSPCQGQGTLDRTTDVHTRNCRTKTASTRRQQQVWHNASQWRVAVNTALQSMAEPGIGQSHQQHRRLV